MEKLLEDMMKCSRSLSVHCGLQGEVRPAPAWALLQEGWAHSASLASVTFTQSGPWVLDGLRVSCSTLAQKPLSRGHCTFPSGQPVGRLVPGGRGWSQL